MLSWFDLREGVVKACYAIRNPDKLGRVELH